MRLGCILGSFDPPHRGHEWMMSYLLERNDRLLVLVPAVHFTKTISSPRNSRLPERMDMLAMTEPAASGRMMIGMTDEVIFLHLEKVLGEAFPDTEITFGMGNDTYAKVSRTAEYVARTGSSLALDERESLSRLLSRITVFGRSSDDDRCVVVPQAVKSMSSTRIRSLADMLSRSRAPRPCWQWALRNLLSHDVREFWIDGQFRKSAESEMDGCEFKNGVFVNQTLEKSVTEFDFAVNSSCKLTSVCL